LDVSGIRPTPQQVAAIDQKAADLAALGRLLGLFRRALLEAGFSEREAFRLVARLYETVLEDNFAFDDDDD
jgi:hypothetical protein